MPAEKAHALVLRTFDFSESSLVVVLYTREFGKVRALAKGGRRIKGPFESALDLLTRIRVVFLRKASDALDLLTEAKLERRFRPRREHLASLYAGYYVAELLNEFTDDYQPEEALFDLADEVLEGLPEAAEASLWVARFEMRLLQILGHVPMLTHCVECGADMRSRVRLAFGHDDGGVLCPRCRAGKRHVAAIDQEVAKVMQRLADENDTAWRRISMSPRCKGALRGLLNHHICHLLGKRPRMHEYLGMLLSDRRKRSFPGRS